MGIPEGRINLFFVSLVGLIVPEIPTYIYYTIFFPTVLLCLLKIKDISSNDDRIGKVNTTLRYFQKCLAILDYLQNRIYGEGKTEDKELILFENKGFFIYYFSSHSL